MSKTLLTACGRRSVDITLDGRPSIRTAAVGVQAIAIKVAVYVDAEAFPWSVASTVDGQGGVDIRIAREDGFIHAAVKLDDIRKHQLISKSFGDAGVIAIRGYLAGSRLIGASLAFRHHADDGHLSVAA